MLPALKALFEAQVQFQLADGSAVDGGVFIGETEFLPVETLQDDEAAYRAEFDRWLSEIWIPDQRQRREIILQSPGNAARYDHLCRYLKNDVIVPFVGSGMSAPSGLPTWGALLEALAQNLPNRSAFRKSLRRNDYEAAADALEAGMNRRQVDEQIEQNLRVNENGQIAGSVRFLPALFPKLVITTNLDDVLERCFEDCETRFAETLAGIALAQYRERKNAKESFLLKLHGDCGQSAGRVLSTREYEAAYGPGSLVREELRIIYQNNHLLFLGCSLYSDRTIELIRDISQADPNMPKHYAFLKLPGNTTKRREREAFLTDRGIYPIWYDGDHDESITSLLAGLLETMGVI